MFDLTSSLQNSRRRFLTDSLHGAGAMAMAGLLSADFAEAANVNGDPLAAKETHFPGKAKHIIYIYLEGGPSQMDLFDPKPKLTELDGQPMPTSLAEDAQFAFLQKETARLMGTSR